MVTVDRIGPQARIAYRARIAGSVAYAAQGICFAALVTRIPSLQDRFELSDTAPWFLCCWSSCSSPPHFGSVHEGDRGNAAGGL